MSSERRRKLVNNVQTHNSTRNSVTLEVMHPRSPRAFGAMVKPTRSHGQNYQATLCKDNRAEHLHSVDGLRTSSCPAFIASPLGLSSSDTLQTGERKLQRSPNPRFVTTDGHEFALLRISRPEPAACRDGHVRWPGEDSPAFGTFRDSNRMSQLIVRLLAKH